MIGAKMDLMESVSAQVKLDLDMVPTHDYDHNDNNVVNIWVVLWYMFIGRY